MAIDLAMEKFHRDVISLLTTVLSLARAMYLQTSGFIFQLSVSNVHREAKKPPFYFCHKFVKPSYILIIFGTHIGLS